MNNSISIITFHRSLNYGSALQAWALVQAIKEECNIDVEIIDYIPNNYSDLYSIFNFPKSLSIAKQNIIHLYYYSYLKKRKRDFYLFRKRHLPLSDKQYSSDFDFNCYVKTKTMVICGSDQIWNPDAKDFDLNYLLPFCGTAKKISYAASLGNASITSNKTIELFRQYLQKFDHISVREETGADKLRMILGGSNSIDVVLDPTLLLDSHDYGKIMSRRIVNTPYIFFYSVWSNEESIKATIKFGKECGLPIYTLISGNIRRGFVKHSRQLNLPRGDIGPSGFLSLIYHSKYVITDSFHGTVFSLMFEKEFLSINTVQKNGQLKNDERIVNILRKTGLLERYVPSHKIDLSLFEKPIDYFSVTKKRKRESEKSKEYIIKCLAKE